MRSLLLALLVVGTSLPAAANDARASAPLLAVGTATFASTYLATLGLIASGAADTLRLGCTGGSDYVKCEYGSTFLFVPVAGPFIDLAFTSWSRGSAILLADGLLQAGGLAMIIAGAALHRDPPKVSIALSTRGGVGVTVGGRF